jgi:hypothetical protein
MTTIVRMDSGSPSCGVRNDELDWFAAARKTDGILRYRNELPPSRGKGSSSAR